MQKKKIKIKKETYERLTKKGKSDESIDEILTRILDTLDHSETEIPQMQPITDSIMTMHQMKKPHQSPSNIV